MRKVLSNKSMGFINSLKNHIKFSQRDIYTSFSLAKLISDKQELGLDTVDDFNTFYNTVYRTKINGLLNKVYSYIEFDIDEVQELVKQFLRVRYSMIHTRLLAITPVDDTTESKVCSLMGIHSVSHSLIKTIADEYKQYQWLYNNFNNLITELETEQ